MHSAWSLHCSSIVYLVGWPQAAGSQSLINPVCSELTRVDLFPNQTVAFEQKAVSKDEVGAVKMQQSLFCVVTDNGNILYQAQPLIKP